MIYRVAFLMLALLPGLLAAETVQWKSVNGKSRIDFASSVEGIPFEGEFHRFSVTLTTNPDGQPQVIAVEVDLGSADTQQPDRDEILQSKEFFGKNIPKLARFEGSVTPLSGNRHQADGNLRINGIVQGKKVEFELTEDQGLLRISASDEINRLLFDIGTGEYSDTDALPDPVQVSVDWKLAKQ